ncbi:MAG: insulinase family protein [Gemmatimonadetes bacterium]|nr:insulinase family protein [Gemmatimonadota bacterium]
MIQRPSATLALHRDTHRVRLPNGLTLLVRRDPSAPVAAIVTWVRAGYLDEADDEVGISHVLEHMFFKGTPARGVGVLAQETKALGGYLNAHTIYDHTAYYAVVPSAAVVPALELQFDAYAHASLDAGELARELEVIVQEAQRKRDTPGAVTVESLYALLHDRHRMRRWRIGEPAELRGFTRERLARFYRHWYRPSTTIVSIVGDVDPDAMVREVEARHGTLPGGDPGREPPPCETAPPGGRVRELAGDVAQLQLALGWRLPPRDHPDTPALELAALLLGAGRASRLYREVRERSLASGVSAWATHARETGVFVVQGELPLARAPEALPALWRTVRRLAEDGVHPGELARVRRLVEARWLRRLEDMEGQAMYLASWEADGGLDVGAAYYDALLTTPGDAVQAAVRRHLDPSQVAVLSYRPQSAAPLVPDLATWESRLATAAPVPVAVPVTETVAPVPVVPAVVHLRGINTEVFEYRTDGGVPVLVLPRPQAPLVHVGVFQRGGALLDPAGEEGVARVMATALLGGSVHRSAAALAEAAEALGSSIGVNAGAEALSWSMSVPPGAVAEALTLLGEVVGAPAFPDERVETERALALAELARQRDDMARWPMRLAMEAAYGAHPYARSVVGTDLSLPAIGRAQVAAYHEAHVRQGAVVVAVSGPVEPSAVAALASAAFAGVTWRDDLAPPPVQWPSAAQQRSESRHKKQTALALLFPGVGRRDLARFPAQVLSAVLGGLGGRLFEQLRGRQSLAYTVSAGPAVRRGGGHFAAYIATDPLREAEARDGLLRELAALTREPPTPEELARARQYLIGMDAIARQSGGAVLGELVDAWLFGEGVAERLDTPRQLAAVTAESVLACAQQGFRPEVVAEGIVRGTG